MQRRASAAAASGPRQVELPPLDIRAAVVPDSINEEDRTAELTFSTGASVERYDWMSGKRYLEVLSLDPANIRLDRLNDGGPVLDSHSAWSVADILGAVVPGSVTITKNAARATVRFARGASSEEVWQKVADGIIRSVSVGYRVYKFEETEGKNNALPVRKAIDWEPFEISMVPIPADAGAKVRDGKTADANRCEIVTAARAEAATAASDQTPQSEDRGEASTTTPEAKEKTVDDKRSETIVEQRPANPVPASAPGPTEQERATRIERERSQGIIAACRAAMLPSSYSDKLIADGVELGDARGQVLEELGRRGGDANYPHPRPRVEITGDDPLIHQRKGIENALLHRIAPQFFKLDDTGRRYMGTSLMEFAEIFLRAIPGVDIHSMSKMERAGMALQQRSGMHSTSDFPLLLADVTGKTLRAAYEAAPQTFGPLSMTKTLSDFKLSKQLQLGEAPGLLEVGEGGEFLGGTIGEGKEQFQLKTYGRIFPITRQALINDDLNAFAEVPTAFGKAARNLESELAWAQITSNPTMGDGVALFHSTHGNLDASGAVISLTSLGVGRAAMRAQKGLDAATILNLFPVFLIVPAALETVAEQFVAQIAPAQASNVNAFGPQGRTPLTVVVEPRLDAADANAWYLATSPAQAPVLYYGLLEGQSGPVVEQELGFEIDGLKIKCRHDVAFKAADFRAIYKNVGA